MFRRKLVLIVLGTLMCAALGVVGLLLGKMFYGNGNIISNLFSKDKTFNILFMGIDARDAHSNSRSDTMIMGSIDTKSKKIVLVSIPRDTMVETESGKKEKINSVNLLKGPEGACEEVSKILGMDVNYYVVCNFAGFKNIIDTLGGVDINVESNMRHPDPVNPELAINLHRGFQHLDGKQALAYVRYRGGPTADIGRTKQQQNFLKALAKQMIQTKTILKLPELIPELTKNIHTNLSLGDMVYLANSAKKSLQPENIISQTLPGYPYTDPGNGASYWLVDKTESNGIVTSLLEGKTPEVYSKVPALVKKTKTLPKKVVSPNETLPKEDVIPNEPQPETGQEPDSTVNNDDQIDTTNNNGNESITPPTDTTTDNDTPEAAPEVNDEVIDSGNP
jgi:LCP family protein required for cell wall assembly